MCICVYDNGVIIEMRTSLKFLNSFIRYLKFIPNVDIYNNL